MLNEKDEDRRKLAAVLVERLLLTTHDLCRMYSVHRNTVGKWERGEAPYPESVIKHLMTLDIVWKMIAELDPRAQIGDCLYPMSDALHIGASPEIEIKINEPKG